MALHNKKKAFMVAMGSYGCVLPFQAIGFDAVVLTDENMNSVPQMVTRFANEECAIVFMEETVFERFLKDMNDINEKTALAVVPIPDQTGSKGIGFSSIRQSVERAGGMDIFSVQ